MRTPDIAMVIAMIIGTVYMGLILMGMTIGIIYMVGLL